jgi:hypothetical protein
MALIIILIKCRFVSRETTLTKYSLHSLKKIRSSGFEGFHKSVRFKWTSFSLDEYAPRGLFVSCTVNNSEKIIITH